MQRFDVVVLGAGAAGMMCAWQAAARGRRVLVVDHATAPGEKIRISGGGRCNFTNLGTTPRNFLSQNPSFCISALKRYSQHDVIALIQRHGIAFHEKTLGQLFCDGSATQIVTMLTGLLAEHGAELMLETEAVAVDAAADGGYTLSLAPADIRGRRAMASAPRPLRHVSCTSLVIATGGKSIPKMGASGFGYQLAERFGLPLLDTRPALVPLTLDPDLLGRLAPLAGVAVDATARHGKTSFAEAMLFTHRGLSGPAILQISSYWREGDEITLAMAPGVDVFAALRTARGANGRQAPQTALAELLPKRLAQSVIERLATTTPLPQRLADCPDKLLRLIEGAVNGWSLKPAGSEGYRTAEVTLGGVDTRALDSRTMEAKAMPGLYLIGEVVDVTGWLGGYNFQWAWSSGWCAGQVA